MKYHGESYAAKVIHGDLLPVNRDNVDLIARSFRQDCQLLRNVKHENIVHFVGLCFLSLNSRLPVLVFEKLYSSLEELVELVPDISLPVSVYVLKGICQGLKHLHDQGVAHCGLTARNVLLTAFLRPKIADIQNCNVVQIMKSEVLARRLTGNNKVAYMPPEALADQCASGHTLDVFAFGVLQLYVLTQVSFWLHALV